MWVFHIRYGHGDIPEQSCRGIVYELWDQIVLGWEQWEGTKVCTWKFGKSVQVPNILGRPKNIDNKLTHRSLLGLVPPFSRFSYPFLLFILWNLLLPTRPRHKSFPYPFSWIHVPTPTTRSVISPVGIGRNIWGLHLSAANVAKLHRNSEWDWKPTAFPGGLLRDFGTCPPFVSCTNKKVQLR